MDEDGIQNPWFQQLITLQQCAMEMYFRAYLALSCLLLAIRTMQEEF